MNAHRLTPAAAQRRITAGRTVRHTIFGEAGPLPALILGGVALMIAVVAAGGPRALVTADNHATRQAIAQAPPLDSGVVVSADLSAGPGAGVPTAATIGALTRAFAAELPSPRLFARGGSWAGLTAPQATVTNAAPSAAADSPPMLEVVYRTELGRNSVLVAGSLPAGAAFAQLGSRRAITLQVAVTQHMAVRFSLRPGSVIDLSPPRQGGPAVLLKVTGIVRPVAADSSFWQADPVLNTPTREGTLEKPHWLSGVFAAPGDLAAINVAYLSQAERYTWFYPFGAGLTAADVGRIEAGTAALAISPAPRAAEQRLHATALAHTAVTTGLANGLASFNAQWQGTTGADSLLVFGLFAAGMILLLICANIAADAYRPELALLRVRGASVAQLARRMLARSCSAAIPGLACGAVIGVVVLPDGRTAVAWWLLGLTALTAIGALPVLCVLAHRRPQAEGAASRADLVIGRPSLRRLVAELMVLAVAGAAIADVRLRGASSGNTSLYLTSSAVLIAVAVALVVNRAYRGPLRVLAALASGRPGPAGFVGLSRAARSRAGSVLPALVLMLTVTLSAFAAMVTASVASGQVAASWAQVGADALVFEPGTAPVTAADLRAFAAVPGVTHVASVYTAPSTSSLAVSLATGGATVPTTGIAVVDPRAYAALAASSPWPGFPAAALARPRSAGPARRVPILVTPDLAALLVTSNTQLEFAGATLPVRVVGSITDTPAMPAGGSYVVMPAWAGPMIPSIPPPSTVLLTGSRIDLSALRSTAARMLPGSQVTVRRQVLSALRSAPALHLSESLYLAGGLAAAALSVLALLFAVAASARSRNLMLTRLTALGLARREALLLRLTDAIPLLSVAAIGAVAATLLLADIIGPVLGLTVFTGSAVPVPLTPAWPDLVIPLAGASVLAVASLAVGDLRSGRHEISAALRQEEAG